MTHLRRLFQHAVDHPRRVVAVTLGVVVLWMLYQGVTAVLALHRAAGEVDDLKAQLARGESAAVRGTLADLQESASTARDNSDGPLWAVASWTPLLGSNVDALRVISKALDEVAADALPPLVEVAADIKANSFTPKDGQVDIAAMKRVAPALKDAAETLAAAKAEVDDLDPGSVLGRLRRPVTTFKNAIVTGAEAANAAAQTAQIAPQMLGDDGQKRRYMLIFQTNAEIRSLGGIPGSWAIIEAENGKVSMTVQGDTLGIGIPERPVDEMTADEATVFSDLMVTDPRNTVVNPDFPRAASLISTMLRLGAGHRVDGVISVDPVTLGYLLRGTGPVVVDGVKLTAANAAFMLLNRSYATMGDAAQDEFFENTARAVFDAVVAGGGNSQALLRGLVQAADENRVLVWSSHADEQKRIATTGVSGVLAGDDGDVPHVGLYLNDATEAKLQYYLDTFAQAVATQCKDGRQTIEFTTRMSSAAPPGVTRLPNTVLGYAKLAPKGVMNVTARIYAPFGGTIEKVSVDGKPETVYVAEHHGRPVTFVYLRLKPGDQTTITTVMRTAKGQTADGVFSKTPGMHPQPNDVEFASAC